MVFLTHLSSKHSSNFPVIGINLRELCLPGDDNMNTRAVVILLLIVPLVILIFPYQTHAQYTTTHQSDDIVSSAAQSAGSVVTYETAAKTKSAFTLVAEKDILLIQTSDPWENSDHYVGGSSFDGVTSDTMVLDSLGYSYDVATWNDIENAVVNMFSYPVVLIVNDQVQEFYDEYASRVSEFENYVANGGVLVFFAASDGWAQGRLNASLPHQVQLTTPHYEYNCFIANSEHPIVTAQLSDAVALTNGDLYSNYCGHGYFSNLPQDARVILSESHDFPTMVEYSIGRGRVIASTLTWEHNWAYHTGSDQYGTFARKALDDVFLYAFSGGGTLVNDLTIDLRVEDAPDTVRVKKSAGSYVDIIARISGVTEYAPRVILNVPNNLFGLPVKTFTRNLVNDSGYGQENSYSDLGSGNYRIETTLKPLGDTGAQSFYKEIVWRFKVPDNLSPQNDIELTATIAVPGLIIANTSDKVKLDVIDWGLSIVITNRKLLFDKFGSDSTEMSLLLEEVYKALSFYWGEVFYVDRYDVTWNQTNDESASNKVAEKIDTLTEDWYENLTRNSEGLKLRPKYMLIIGGDEIIPFYRMDDDDYQLSCMLPHPLATCEEDTSRPENYVDLLWSVAEDNYFLSDNIYSDVGGGKAHWEKGKLELATGRIVGSNAKSMRILIENGKKTKALVEAGLISTKYVDVDQIYSRLLAKKVGLYGLSNPNLVENDSWNRKDFLTGWEHNSQFLFLGVHANPISMSPVTEANPEQQITPPDLTAGRISTNHPVIVSWGCNLAVPVRSGLVHKIIDLGASGLVGSSGLALANRWGISGAEELVNDYAVNLIRIGENSNYSNQFGKALIDAKSSLSASGPFFNYTGADKKTILEYIYYGLPWAFMETPDNVQAALSMPTEATYHIRHTLPQQTSINNYSVQLNTDVTGYTISNVEGYQLLNVADAERLAEPNAPTLPYVLYTLDLPLGSVVTGINLISEHLVNLGQRNIPSLVPLTTYDTGSGLAPVTGFSGIYPTIRYSYDTMELADRLVVRVAIAVAQFNIDSKVLTLFDHTQLQLNYATTNPAVVRNLEFSRPQFSRGDEITAQAQVYNASAQPHTLAAILSIYNDNGIKVDDLSVPSFTIAGGESYLLPLASTSELVQGGYTALLTLKEGNTALGGTSESFQVLAGGIDKFDVPVYVKKGDFANFSLIFANYKTSSVNVTADIYVYDLNNIQVGKLLQRNFAVNANAVGETSWTWSPENLMPGQYTVEAVVNTEDELFTSSREDLIITPNVKIGNIILTANPMTVPADGISTSTITAKVMDTSGNSVANQLIAFTTSLGALTDSAITDGSGSATVILISSAAAGIATINAASDDVNSKIQIEFTTLRLPGDCNSDQAITASDVTALALEFFDGDDNSNPLGTSGGTYAGSPACDANEDSRIGASDVTCIARLFFNGPGACRTAVTTASVANPSLAMPQQIPAVAGGQVAVPITLNSHGATVGSLLFSIDYDETWLQFDPTDGDGNGIPDAITAALPAEFVHAVTFDPTDTDGELDFVVSNFAATPLALTDGQLLTVTFQVGRPPTATAAAIRFAQSPGAAFGDPQGQELTGKSVDGTVSITLAPDTPAAKSFTYLPLITHTP